MQLVRCEQGHFYDPSKYRQCPHCEVYADQDIGYTVAKAPEPEAFQPAPPSAPAGNFFDEDDQKTVGLAQRSSGFNPICGWLVCVSGAARGTDYHIYPERNTLGRSAQMDICVKGDLGISRESHAVISYNPRERTFTLIPGEGKSIIYLNGQELLMPAKLTAYDRIEISETTLLFVPLCQEIFSWDDEANR